MKKYFRVWTACALLAVATACTKSSTPARPSDAAPEAAATATDASSGISLTAPTPLTPLNGITIPYAEQPTSLVVRNGVSTSSAAATYTFQVASDSGFASIVATRDGVAAGANGQTSVTLDRLTGNRSYYWRARLNSGGASSPFSAVRAWTVGPEVILQAPALLFPANGGTLSGNGSLVVANAARTGPAGAISYRFEVSDSSSFADLVAAGSVGEQSGQTAMQVTERLTSNATYYWRVRASDPSNNATGPYSEPFSFRYTPFDMANATILNSPRDLGVWPEAARITSIDFTGYSFNVDFDRRDGANRWPDVVPAGWDGPLQYTLGMCVNINDHWYCSAVVQFWHGRDLAASAPPYMVGREWFYDPVRWGAMHNYQPREGETVGLFVAAGNLRDGGNFTRATCPRVCERSNVVLIPWTSGAARFSVSSVAR